MINYTFTLENFEYWLLILTRLTAFVAVAPFFKSSSVPGRVKIGFAALVSLIIYNVAARPAMTYEGVMGYAVVVLGEGITGLLIGMAADVCSSIILFSGTIIDMDIGLSMATEFNPELKSETSLTGNLYYYLLFLILISSDIMRYLLDAICDSFEVIPIGNTNFRWDHLFTSFSQYMTDALVLGFRIFLPVFSCIMILNCVLGVMARVAPQMNMFAVGMQLKVMVGFMVIFLTYWLLPAVADMLFEEIKKMVTLFAEGMYRL